MNKRLDRRNKRGFTLIEVMVVLFILLAMAGAGVVAVQGVRERANKENTLLQIRAMSSAIEAYWVTVGSYPSTDQGLNALLNSPAELQDSGKWSGPYLKDNVQTFDAWGNPYQYQSPGERMRDSYDVWSFGPDGMNGTEDDIGNWTK